MRVNKLTEIKRVPLGACEIRYLRQAGIVNLITLQNLESGSGINIIPQTMVDDFGVERVMYYNLEADVYFRNNINLKGIAEQLDQAVSRRVEIALTFGTGTTEFFNFTTTNEINADSRMTAVANGTYTYSVETIDDVFQRFHVKIRARERRMINSSTSNITLYTPGPPPPDSQ